MPEHVPLPGSERAEIPDAQPAGELDRSQRIEVTLVLRRRAELPPGTSGLSGPELGERYGADPSDMGRVRSVLATCGLSVASQHPASRRMRVEGTAGDLCRAFGTSLRLVSSPAVEGTGRVIHRYRTGALFIPAELEGIVTAVLGLDDRPAARAHFRRAADVAAVAPMTPPQAAEAYGFPDGTDGTGQTIAIIELGGGFSTADLADYFSDLGITAPSVTAVSVDGAVNSPGQAADDEVMLDIEVAGAISPGAALLVYFVPNTEQGLADAISEATHASVPPTAMSISWGLPEGSWTAQARSAIDAALADAAAVGATATASAGDHGSSDGISDNLPHVDFPASSPHALACGGTRLLIDQGEIISETVWNDQLSGAPGAGATGGGTSDVFALPEWQASAGVPVRAPSSPVPPSPPTPAAWRGVPDVAGNADPGTGYEVLVNGEIHVYGGTSAVAPLWAALIVRLAQAAGKPFGLLQPLLYAGITPGVGAPGFNDITDGSNGTYSAGPGWDPCTGLGSPDGEALLTRVTPQASHLSKTPRAVRLDM